MRVNKYKLAIFVLSLSLLTGCSENVSNYVHGLMSNTSDFALETTESTSEQIEENVILDPHKYAVNTFNEVFKLVQAKDTQAIFDMFSEYARENADIMPEIETLVEFMNGEIIEIGHVGASNQYSSVQDGVTVKAAYSATAHIKTNNEITYWFDIGVITADEDETKLGLDWIYVLDSKAFDAYVKECGEWRERKKNGIKEDEPPRPEDMEVCVNY